MPSTYIVCGMVLSIVQPSMSDMRFGIRTSWVERIIVMSGIVYMLKTSRMNFRNYCYIITDTEQRNAVIVDPSWQPELINELLEEKELILRAVLLTHSHPDHTNLADYYAKNYHASVYMSRVEQISSGFRCKNLCSFEDRERILVGEIEAVCILTPGHTRGSTCILIGESLFTGDTVFNEGVGLCESYNGSLTDMFQSLQRLKREIPPATIIYPGHCYGEQLGKSFQSVCKKNVYFHFNTLDQFIRFRTRKGQSGLFNFV